MPLLPATSAPVQNFDGNTFTGLASPSRGAVETAAWRVSLPAGRVSEGTHQLTREELLIVLTGTAVATIAEEVHTVMPGDTIVVPAFTDFRIDNASAAPFEAIAVLPVGGRAILPGRPAFTPPWAI